MKIVHTACLVVLLLSGLNAQSGGGFELTETVIAPAGGASANGIFEADLAIGQPISETSASGNSSVTSGFWNFTPLAPTAASISISGRVQNGSGAGVTNAILYLQTQDGQILVARSSSFGYYQFDNIIAGQLVVISVQSKRFSYVPRSIIVADKIGDFDFIPEQ